MQLVADGHAERVPMIRSANAYFMPHRGVWKENALTTKLRVVFDASSHRRDQDPLNARLTKGVDLNPSIVSLMIKFRIDRVAAIADLQKAFLQIRILDRDRDFLRFLWIYSDGRLIAYRMTSVPFGATCSPFLLAVVIRFHLLRHQSSHPSAGRLLGNIYVDDLVVTADSVDKMHSLHDDSVELFRKFSMHLHKWRASDIQLDNEWSAADSPAEAKVLGTRWWPASDTIAPVAPMIGASVVSRRVLLRQLGSIFDPLGLWGSIIIDN